MSTLQRLVLSCEGQEPWLTDAGLEAIKGLPQLKTLVMAGQEQVTDDGVACITEIPSLRCVCACVRVSLSLLKCPPTEWV